MKKVFLLVFSIMLYFLPLPLIASNLEVVESQEAEEVVESQEAEEVEQVVEPYVAPLCNISNYREFIFNEEEMAQLRKMNQFCHLEYADLSGAILQGADLQGALFFNVDLGGADLYQANLEGAFLENANLQGTNLQEADLQGMNVHKANLQEADFQGANLEGVNLEDAVSLVGAKYNDDTKFPSVLFDPEAQGMIKVD